MKRIHFITFLAAFSMSLDASAQNANESVKVIVPFAAGGPADLVARMVATPLSVALGKPVWVYNRGGAGGVIGVAAVAKAPADGNTLLLTTSSFVITAGITPNLAYNPRKDLEPVYLLGEVQTMLAVRSSLGVNTLSELVTKAKGPNKLNYGSTGVGGTMHIGAELFGKAANVSVVHIPYKGAAPAINDLMAGTVDFVNADVPILRSFVKDGRIKALVIYDTKRSPLLPDVPTAVEAGLPGLMMSNWYGVLVPAGTSVEAKKRLEEAFAKVVRQPEVAARLAEAGFMNPRDAAGFKTLLDSSFDRWLPWLKEANIRAD